MSGPLLFAVAGRVATPVQRITLAEAGLHERRDLQEWVLAHPEILGDDLLIVTFEFDRWQASGARPADRLDILALDTDGRPVVVELKRDRAPDTVEMQSIKYAAMVSRFTPESLAEQYARFLSSVGSPTSDEEALEALESHVGGALDVETLRRPRIVVAAGDYPPVVTATAVWLNEMGIDFTLVQVSAYRTAHDVLILTSQLYPVRDVEEFTVTPRQAEVKAVDEKRQRQRDVTTISRLVEAALLEEGTELHLQPAGINDDLKTRVAIWLESNPGADTAEWTNDPAGPTRWGLNGKSYAPSSLAGHILEQATGISRAIRGGQWWVTDDGRDLVEVARELGSERQKLYLDFWTRFAERLKSLHPDWIETRGTPASQNWFDMNADVASGHYSAAFMREPRIKYELYIDSASTERNRQLFDRLLGRRPQIEARCGRELEWRPPDAKHRHAAVVLAGTGRITDLEHHEEIMSWFIEAGERLRSAISEEGPG